ncbi:MAG TPA: helix-hairpin-helix domain-containing protein [Micromonosporaceae bacterium]|nr:helix-hairpin-helix domain-containing protein [Micromonosporaceae bacterium]
MRSWQLSPAAVRALAVVAVVVAVVAAVVAWRGRPTVEPVAVASTVAVPSVAASVPPAEYVVVAVSGRVRQPGIVRLPAGARVADAIEAAGGALDNDDLALVNLARKVSDGELILVGVTPPPGAGAEVGGAEGGTGGSSDGLVNLNTATSAQLQTLPGIGPVLAERIIAYREQHGGFEAVSDLRKVTGIGDARYDELKDLVTV